jgi:hypothetical protein
MIKIVGIRSIKNIQRNKKSPSVAQPGVYLLKIMLTKAPLFQELIWLYPGQLLVLIYFYSKLEARRYVIIIIIIRSN